MDDAARMPLRSFRPARALTQFYRTAAAAAALWDRVAPHMLRFSSDQKSEGKLQNVWTDEAFFRAGRENA